PLHRLPCVDAGHLVRVCPEQAERHGYPSLPVAAVEPLESGDELPPSEPAPVACRTIVRNSCVWSRLLKKAMTIAPFCCRSSCVKVSSLRPGNTVRTMRSVTTRYSASSASVSSSADLASSSFMRCQESETTLR